MRPPGGPLDRTREPVRPHPSACLPPRLPEPVSPNQQRLWAGPGPMGCGCPLLSQSGALQPPRVFPSSSARGQESAHPGSRLSSSVRAMWCVELFPVCVRPPLTAQGHVSPEGSTMKKPRTGRATSAPVRPAASLWASGCPPRARTPSRPAGALPALATLREDTSNAKN